MSVVQPAPTLSGQAVREAGIPTYNARDLVRDGVQVRILLDDQSYWLRITRAGKLILTK